MTFHFAVSPHCGCCQPPDWVTSSQNAGESIAVDDLREANPSVLLYNLHDVGSPADCCDFWNVKILLFLGLLANALVVYNLCKPNIWLSDLWGRMKVLSFRGFMTMSQYGGKMSACTNMLRVISVRKGIQMQPGYSAAEPIDKLVCWKQNAIYLVVPYTDLTKLHREGSACHSAVSSHHVSTTFRPSSQWLNFDNCNHFLFRYHSLVHHNDWRPIAGS